MSALLSIVYDVIHFAINFIDSFNKKINFILSKRGSGKTTAIIRKAWKYIFKGYNAVFISRRIIDITDKYVRSIVEIYNKFHIKKIEVKYKINESGVCEVFNKKDGKLLYTIVALNAPEERLRKMFIQKCKIMVFDEFIVRSKLGGKYLKGEYEKFQFLYTTIAREYDYKTKVYFLGNPYTLYNPYFHALGVNPREIKEGCLIKGDNYVLQYYKVTSQLQEIIDRNPFKDEVDGLDVQDDNFIPLFEVIPLKATLRFAIYFRDTYYGFWSGAGGYWYIKDFKYSGKKATFVLNLDDMVNGRVLYTRDDKFYLNQLNYAVKLGKFFCDNINTYYNFRAMYDIM